MALPDYRIDEVKAPIVVARTRTHVQEFAGQREDLARAVERAAGSSNSALIMGALQEVYDGYQGKLATVLDHTAQNVVNEADRMIAAYQAGDRQMADDARRAADDVAHTAEEAR
ncbi:hypothetical protein E7744_12980 [Citricoccus sp. SGAir0253]|uniref:DUF6507 family protein n=1 Tax=Citricoccus sp. SGAir0253 TaxID=2567881 RepID=UPI0010CCC676|nr:DUF6507 family protein [Citricoccus sp. SGAir0253]QCU78939.1 hypothetical protein E7744_12980 [Citricoccus sp. SGAir0253]